MPNKCWTPGCKSNYYSNDPYRPVFKSPDYLALRQAWLNALHREHENASKVFYVSVLHFHDKDIEVTFKVNGVDINISRERPLLVKGAIPSILPSCPSHLSSTSTSRLSRFSYETNEEGLFTIARNLSLEIQEIEVNKFKVDCFSNLR